MTDLERAKARMVREHLRGRGIRDSRVLDAMASVPRERFVAPGMEGAAYEDRPLSIGQGQTISQPYIVAYMTEMLRVESHHRVLDIGTGSGYQTAVLAELAEEVYTIEIVAPLAERAKSILEAVGYDNVHYRIGDGRKGWPEAAPFDRILAAAAPTAIPEALVDQLAEGGVLVTPVGGLTQELVRVERNPRGLSTERLLPVRFVPMTGSAE